MKLSMSLVAAAALLLVFNVATRADDCAEAVKNMSDAVQVASQALQMDIADITKERPSDDKAKASLKNKICSATGEFLGVSRVYRAVASGCLEGSKKRETVASLDKSIKEMTDSIRQTCD